MDNKKKIVLTLVIGFIFIAVTLIIFLMGGSNGDKTILDWLAMTFVFIAEFSLIGGLVLMTIRMETMNATLLKAGTLSTLFIYFAITVLLAIFRVFFAENAKGFISIQVTIFGIAAIIIMALIISASIKEKNKNESYLLKTSEIMAFSLKSNPQYRNFADILNNLYEELKYSEKTKSIQELDQTINYAVMNLSEALKNDLNTIAKENIKEKVENIILQIKEHNMAVMQMKQ